MPQRYSLGAIILHWLIAALLAFQLSAGFGLEHLGMRGFALYQLHKSVGMLVLALTVLRILWRLFAARPPALEKGWQGTLAGLVHAGLYLFMLGAPLTGWLLVSTDGVLVPTLLFSTIPLPHLPAPHTLNAPAHAAHAALGWIGIALFTLHVAGALRHQWQLRDPVLQRMSLGRSAWPILPLAALMPVAWWLGSMALSAAHQGAPTRPALMQQPPMTAPAGTESAAPQEAAPANAAEPSVASNASAPPPRWAIRPGGLLAFAIDNGGTRIDGRFARWSGDIAFDPDHPETAAIRITIDTASASVGDATQDGMLLGQDFLDTAAHPSASFRTKTVERTGPGQYRARGTLTLKGISKAQVLRFTLTGKDLARHAEGSTTISRTAFGIGGGEAAAALADNVTLTFRFDARGTAVPQ